MYLENLIIYAGVSCLITKTFWFVPLRCVRLPPFLHDMTIDSVFVAPSATPDLSSPRYNYIVSWQVLLPIRRPYPDLYSVDWSVTTLLDSDTTVSDPTVSFIHTWRSGSELYWTHPFMTSVMMASYHLMISGRSCTRQPPSDSFCIPDQIDRLSHPSHGYWQRHHRHQNQVSS
jgi:hypothetical protein